jgi:hypothetical protein
MKRVLIYIGIFLFGNIAIAQEIPVPENLRARWDDESRTILLTWDSLELDIAGYHLFAQQPEQGKMYLFGPAGQLAMNSYSFPVKGSKGGLYKFRVAGFRNFPEMVYGEKSPVVEILVPTTFLPMVSNVEINPRRGIIEITWKYPYEIADLAGYIVSLNDSIIQVGNDRRALQISGLEPAVYGITIKAKTTAGLTSDASAIKIVRVK